MSQRERVNAPSGLQVKSELVMRQNHRACEKLFVEYAVQAAAVIDLAAFDE
ncbi:hypothetical protein HH1059_14080 [Halorhodospira halochloris]|uniref:Uncharacterized protein n=1 Tax=Halorhodospira halochloris TaxID=1052 RepID=A0A2Z6EZW7_HALHR|nr:hypothetical protein [Halorhodospira halochloris]BBE11060.1 hypothetical protein HH1059_13750 [Halorhodospira halochloris]BBE11074.1 hypothetical protein HH1059_14080 [Halorhodospira halochloris]